MFLDVGATAIVPDGIGDKPDLARNGSKPRRRLTGLFAGFGGGHVEQRPEEDTGPIRKPADLVFRLPPHIPISAGQPITVAVHMDALHYFDKFGKRIDVGWSQRA